MVQQKYSTSESTLNNSQQKTRETLASFWRKLKLGTKVKVTYKDTYRNNEGVSFGSITRVQTNSVARDEFNWDKSKEYTKEKPCWFYKPKASECFITENKLVEENKQQSTVVTYEIIEAAN